MALLLGEKTELERKNDSQVLAINESERTTIVSVRRWMREGLDIRMKGRNTISDQ